VKGESEKRKGKSDEGKGKKRNPHPASPYEYIGRGVYIQHQLDALV
jgi:hypothetical protein